MNGLIEVIVGVHSTSNCKYVGMYLMRPDTVRLGCKLFDKTDCSLSKLRREGSLLLRREGSLLLRREGSLLR